MSDQTKQDDDSKRLPTSGGSINVQRHVLYGGSGFGGKSLLHANQVAHAEAMFSGDKVHFFPQAGRVDIRLSERGRKELIRRAGPDWFEWTFTVGAPDGTIFAGRFDKNGKFQVEAAAKNIATPDKD